MTFGGVCVQEELLSVSLHLRSSLWAPADLHGAAAA